MTSIRNIIGVDCFNAPGYEIGRDLVIKSPCCFAGTDDELVVGASDDNNIYVWSSADSLPLRVFRGHHDTINSVRYNSRNSILASCGIEGVVKLWSI
jgi:WD40 repeat protein